MPRPILILVVAVVVLLAVLLGLAAMDREVPIGHVERPLSNVAEK